MAFPKPIAPKFPISTLKPPIMVLIRMPIIGARKSEKERYPPAPPMSMLYGMNLKTMYSAVNIVSKAICLVLWLVWLGLKGFFHVMAKSLGIFSLLCNFLHRSAIKDFPNKSLQNNKPLVLTYKCKI